MKTLIISLFLCLTFSSFGQTKEDILTCLNIILNEDDLDIAFNNNITSGSEAVIVSSGRSNYNANDIQKIRDRLTQDDFYDFDRNIKVVQGDSEQLRRLGIPEIYTLSFSFGGDDNQLMFRLSTQIKGENLQAHWNYKLQKEDDEWEIVGNSMSKNRSVVNDNGF